MQRLRTIRASEVVGSSHPSRARPCTFARLAERDRKHAERIRPHLPGTIAEVATRTGMTGPHLRRVVAELAIVGLVRVAPKLPGLRTEAIVMAGRTAE